MGKKKDIRRQRKIMRYLGCVFIRIKVDRKNNILQTDIYMPEDIPDVYPNNGIITMCI